MTSIVGIATDIAGCPLVNGTIFTAPSGDKYLKLCATDILANNIDIAHTTGVTTFNACIGLCDSLNTEAGKVVCKSAVWDIVDPDYEFCWLKNATKVLTPQSNNGSVATIRQ